jgi:adenylate cyclase
MALSGRMLTLTFGGRYRESSRLASQLVALVGSIGEPMLELTLLPLATAAKLANGELTATLRLAQRVIDLSDGDPRKGGSVIESPLSLALMLAAVARLCQGVKGWKADMANAATMVGEFIPIGEADVLFWKHSLGVMAGALRPDADALQETAGILERAQQRGDDHSLWSASFVHGFMLAQQPEPERSRGLSLLATVREAVTQQHAMAVFLPLIDIEFAKHNARHGDVDGALGMLRAILERETASGAFNAYGTATENLAELLLQRGGPADIAAAQEVIDRLAAAPVEPGMVVYAISLLRLRALLARACGDDIEYRRYVDRYREMAAEPGFEGHIAKADEMV